MGKTTTTAALGAALAQAVAASTTTVRSATKRSIKSAFSIATRFARSSALAPNPQNVRPASDRDFGRTASGSPRSAGVFSGNAFRMFLYGKVAMPTEHEKGDEVRKAPECVEHRQWQAREKLQHVMHGLASRNTNAPAFERAHLLTEEGVLVELRGEPDERQSRAAALSASAAGRTVARHRTLVVQSRGSVGATVALRTHLSAAEHARVALRHTRLRDRS